MGTFHSRLSEADEEQIRFLLFEEKRTQIEIAQRFNVSQSVIAEIKRDAKYNQNNKLVLYGFSGKTLELLNNIAYNKGFGKFGRPQAYLKHVIRKAIEDAPEHLKRKPLDY